MLKPPHAFIIVAMVEEMLLLAIVFNLCHYHLTWRLLNSELILITPPLGEMRNTT